MATQKPCNWKPPEKVQPSVSRSHFMENRKGANIFVLLQRRNFPESLWEKVTRTQHVTCNSFSCLYIVSKTEVYSTSTYQVPLPGWRNFHNFVIQISKTSRITDLVAVHQSLSLWSLYIASKIGKKRLCTL